MYDENPSAAEPAPEPDAPPPIDAETQDAMTALVLALTKMDALAKAGGHSLAQVLETAARNFFGIDIRVPDGVPDDVAAQAAAKEAEDKAEFERFKAFKANFQG